MKKKAKQIWLYVSTRCLRVLSILLILVTTILMIQQYYLRDQIIGYKRVIQEFTPKERIWQKYKDVDSVYDMGKGWKIVHIKN